MNKFKIQSNALRFTMLGIGLVILLGIYLTGFSIVHWLLYLPAIALIFSGLSGICPSLILYKIILKEK